MADGAMCIPNISAAGRKRRTRFSIVMAVVATVWVGVSIAMHASPWMRALGGLFVAAAVATYLQVTRNTCVAHARAGTIEHDDFSTTAAPKNENDASKKVANTILRDGALAGVFAGLLFWSTAWVMP
jgi:hypothetical protein